MPLAAGQGAGGRPACGVPGCGPPVILERAERLLAERRLQKALVAFLQAVAAGEDVDRAAGGQWSVAMLRGDFESAWQTNDGLRARNAVDPHRLWDGKSLAGKCVIVRCLHGFGDAVQMLQYASALAALASEVVWEVAPRLVELVRCFGGVTQVVTWGDGAPATPAQWDSQVEVLELPYIFRTLVRDLPVARKYCSLPAKAAWNEVPQVGLVWAAGDWNRSRSVPFATFESLLDVAGFEFWNLQGSGQREEAPALQRCGDGLIALAETIARMDLVVTVDTLAAHLAGALGRPVWLLLEHAADWRWQAQGDLSPWYPSMRLFRQNRPGDWPELIGRVEEELQRWCR